MAQTDATIDFYDTFFLYLASAMNLVSDTFRMLLVTSSYTFSAAHTVLTDITNELSGNGYSRQALAGVTFTQTSGVGTFDYDPVVFGPATGSGITTRRFVVYNDTVASPVTDPLCYSGLLDDTPADVAVTVGNSLTYTPNGSGQFTIAEAA